MKKPDPYIYFKSFKSLIFSFLTALLISPFFIACSSVKNHSIQKNPNIIFLLTDDHRWDALGANGNKIIHIHTQKSNKQVSIPYHPIIGEILNKYGGNMPKVSEPRINKNIKDVCSNIKSLKNKTVRVKVIRGGIIDFKTYKRYEKVTTHTARNSFASNMYKRNVPVRQIMTVTGHVKEANFFRYIGVSDREQIEALNENFKSWYIND